MVGKTKGFYVRDWPLHLGWNNIRYIIEASLLHAELLDRVLVVPTVVYARACEFDKLTCQAYAKMVNRGDALQSDEWRDSPIEKQWAWLIPTELMMDLALIQRTRPLMTTADYLLLHDLPASLETAKGNWDREAYHSSSDTGLHVIPNGNYDNGISRVDRMPAGWEAAVEEGNKGEGLGKKIREVLEGKTTEEWETVKNQVGRGESEEVLERELRKVGAYVLHTWQGSHGMEYVRTVTEPIKQVSLGEGMKGFWDDYHHITKEVLLLEGETHYWRKPGSLRFTTVPAQTSFAKMVLRDIMPPPVLNAMAIRLDQRMTEKVGGRMWTSAHMRRGDFIHHEWVMNQDGYAHFNRIKEWMGKGRDVLVDIKNSGKVEMYPVPGAVPDESFKTMEPPKKNDPFYLATDERNDTMIAYFKEHGAVMVNDLITPEDRRELAAWSLVFTDVLGVMEQTLLARAGYFYGHALSSVAGGAVNHRGSLNKDPRTTKID
ncbi:hypothetical protein BDY24DRAFT_342213 [Mrakia frigida]|uniref:uncharacterized protein n=1 Tax=Mrakia frigida TaxID=29902 RepID=UPI003FCBFE7A